MKVTVVYGTQRKSCTYNIAQKVIEGIDNAQVEEIFLPRDLPEFCISCLRCFNEKAGTCTHSKYTDAIRQKLLWADLIILASPVYSFHVTGQMKVFLDHFANMWMVHRPEKEMFKKQGIVIATASGPVYSKTLSEMKDSLDFWGVCKTYRLGTAVMQTDWENVSPKIKKKIDKKVMSIVKRAQDKKDNIKPCFRVLKWFYVSRFTQKVLKMNPPDVEHWEQQGWTSKARPWKQLNK